MSINPFSEIPIPHLVIMVESMQETDPPPSKEAMLDNIELINNLLVVMRTHKLLVKKRGLRSMLDLTIGNHIGEDEPDMNTRRRRKH